LININILRINCAQGWFYLQDFLEEFTCLVIWSVRGVCEGGNKPSGLVKDGTCIEYLSDYESYKKK